MRAGRLVLANCESYGQFPPDKLTMAAALCRRAPRLAVPVENPAAVSDAISKLVPTPRDQ
jgi:hypothetical protein